MKDRLRAIPKFLRRNWKKLLLLLVVAGAGGYFLYQRQNPEQEELTFERPQRETLVQTIEVSGAVDAKEKARLSFAEGGRIVYIGAQEGQWIDRGTTVATIDRAELQKQLQKDLNTFKQERIEWDQTLDDFEETDKKIEDSRSKEIDQLDLNNRVLDVEIRTISFRDTYVSAPFDGILTLSPASVTGITLGPTDYFELVNPSTLVFRALVDEADIAQIALDQRGELSLDAFSDISIPTRVNYISYTSTQDTTGTAFIVEFPLADLPESNRMRLGMNGDITIETDRRESALTIPLIATRERDDKVFVDVRTGETTFEEREIKIGLETEEKVEVLTGLSESDQILIPD